MAHDLCILGENDVQTSNKTHVMPYKYMYLMNNISAQGIELRIRYFVQLTKSVFKI